MMGGKGRQELRLLSVERGRGTCLADGLTRHGIPQASKWRTRTANTAGVSLVDQPACAPTQSMPLMMLTNQLGTSIAANDRRSSSPNKLLPRISRPRSVEPCRDGNVLGPIDRRWFPNTPCRPTAQQDLVPGLGTLGYVGSQGQKQKKNYQQVYSTAHYVAGFSPAASPIGRDHFSALDQDGPLQAGSLHPSWPVSACRQFNREVTRRLD